MTHDDAYTSKPIMAMQEPDDDRSSFSLSYLAQRNIVAAELETCEARLAEVTTERDGFAATIRNLIGQLADRGADLHEKDNDLDRLAAEVDRMRPVVEAAVAWNDWWTDEPGHVPWAQMELQGAVDAYRSPLGQDGTARPPQEAQGGPEAAGGTCTCRPTQVDVSSIAETGARQIYVAGRPDTSRCSVHGGAA